MHIAIATPDRPGETSGNEVTATRWGSYLIAEGHRVDLIDVFPDGRMTKMVAPDLLIVLHARRCAIAARWWRANRGDTPMIVALAGTDLYSDLPEDADARWTIDQADALVVLQEAGVARLASFDPTLGDKAQVIHQSVRGQLPPRTKLSAGQGFRVVVLSHLREVKDPLMSARASRLLPHDSSVVVHHAGEPHDNEWGERASDESEANPRYWWYGPLTHRESLELLSSATVLACTSLLEGGANVVSEAIAMGVPVVGTLIEGNTGLLGEDYPGLVPVRDDQALADLLYRLEKEPDLLAELQDRIDSRVDLTRPEVEQAAWAELVSRFGADH